MQIEHPRQDQAAGGIDFARTFAGRLRLYRRDTILIDDDVDHSLLAAQLGISDNHIHRRTM